MLEEEIRLLIEKSLPEQVGKMLKERLAKAESDEKTLKMVEIDLAKSKAIINDLKEQLSKHMVLDQRLSLIDKKESEVLEKERNMKVFEAETKFHESEKRCTEMKDIVSLVFKGKVYNSYVSEYNAGYNIAGQYHDQHTNSKSITTTEE